MVGDDNMNVLVVKQGLAKVLEKKGNMQASKHYDDLIAA